MNIDEIYKKYEVPTATFTSLELVQDFKNLIREGTILFLQCSEPFLIPTTYKKNSIREVHDYYLFEMGGYIYDKLTLKEPMPKDVYMKKLEELNDINEHMPQVVAK